MFKYNNLYLKQIIFIIIGFILIFIINKINIKIIFKYSFYIYLFNVILLLLVLLIGPSINGSTAWFKIGELTIQPSEFMKIGLILILSKIINEKDKDILLILKCLIVTLIPSILTFLEPDTGNVIGYIIILIIMLFFSKIKLKWIITIFLITIIFLISFFLFYFKYPNNFIDLFGTSFFYRIDRLTNFLNNEGMQIENALVGIGSSSFFGHGLNNFVIYVPENQTDFIFSLYLTIFGLCGGLLLLICYFVFNYILLIKIKKIKTKQESFFLSGFLAILLYQEVEHILMNIGLLPITGITLPFFSYGGSSILSFFLLLGISLNIIKSNYYR